MALSRCSDDILFNIASYLHGNFPPAVYCQRRIQTFRHLVLVCRQFCLSFTPLLYRSLCISVEHDSWPQKYEKQWLESHPRRRTSAALLRTLRTKPDLCRYTYYLELWWYEHDTNLAEAQAGLNQLLHAFPHLVELDLCSPYLSTPYRRYWDIDLTQQEQHRHLRSLRITQPISSDMLPHILFNLPNLRSLDVSTFHAIDEDDYVLRVGDEQLRSQVTELSITSMMGDGCLRQLLTVPSALQKFVYKHDCHEIDECIKPQVISTATFITALQPFRSTLKTLRIEIPSRRLEVTNTALWEKGVKYQPDSNVFLDLREFTQLEELQAPSAFFTGAWGKRYCRERLVSHLPSSLRTLEYVFPHEDPFLQDGSPWRVPVYFNVPQTMHELSLSNGYKWILLLGTQCSPWGSLPNLQSVTARDEGGGFRLQIPPILKNIFTKTQITTYICTAPVNLQQDMYGEWEDYEESMTHYEGFNYGPVFGDEQTEYSDSPRSSEVSESAREWELEQDEVFERFDEMMAKEQEGWTRGQWPDYEATREEREDFKRHPTILNWVSAL